MTTVETGGGAQTAERLVRRGGGGASFSRTVTPQTNLHEVSDETLDRISAWKATRFDAAIWAAIGAGIGALPNAWGAAAYFITMTGETPAPEDRVALLILLASLIALVVLLAVQTRMGRQGDPIAEIKSRPARQARRPEVGN